MWLTLPSSSPPRRAKTAPMTIVENQRDLRVLPSILRRMQEAAIRPERMVGFHERLRPQQA